MRLPKKNWSNLMVKLNSKVQIYFDIRGGGNTMCVSRRMCYSFQTYLLTKEVILSVNYIKGPTCDKFCVMFNYLPMKCSPTYRAVVWSLWNFVRRVSIGGP